MVRGLEYLEGSDYKHRSIRQKIDKRRFCKKNVIAPKTFGPHIYEGTKNCVLCGHVKKENRRPY